VLKSCNVLIFSLFTTVET